MKQYNFLINIKKRIVGTFTPYLFVWNAKIFPTILSIKVTTVVVVVAAKHPKMENVHSPFK